MLVQVKNKRERLSPVRPPGVEKTSRLRSRDPVASGVMCGPHGGMNSKMKSSGSLENHWVPWLIHKAKIGEPETVLQQCQTSLTGGYRSDR
jgi:hypothetical protein